MGKYTQDAQQLLRLIGGKENIAAVSHCVTRMRFVLNDPSKADVEAIEAMKVVKGSFTQAGQFQVIIGNAVADFYNDFVKVAGVEGVSKDAVKQAAKKNQNVLQKVIAALAEIFAPLIPAIMAAFVLVYLERFFRKISPQVISSVVVPFCSLVLAVMAAHFIVGPIGWKIGSAISSVVYAGITGSFKVVFGAIFGFVYAPLVITGLHHMSNAIDLQLIADYGGTMLWPMIALSNIAQGSAVMGMIILQKKNVAAQEVNVPAGISCYLGVTEPAIFGVNLKYGFPFICGMIGSAISAVVCVMTSTTANAVGVGGIPGILSIQPKYMGSFAICMVIAFVIPMTLTFIVGKKKLSMADRVGAGDSADTVDVSAEAGSISATENTETTELNGDGANTLRAFLTGKVIPLKEVNDGVFSEGVMGDGLAILPENDTLYAPCDGEVTVLMDESRHACGLTLENGMEILLHIGIDTVEMQGDGFEYLVSLNQKVKQRTPLVRFDREKIRTAGHPDVTVCIVTEEGNAKDFEFVTDIHAEAGKTEIVLFN
ncbi:glucose PTS transporter subunit IIA [Blautia sp.]|uniref:PTS sugar transporter subunit IIBCA n=1 Tax=Blautia sp. TaxID=1955243 RepID=UPI003AB84672